MIEVMFEVRMGRIQHFRIRTGSRSKFVSDPILYRIHNIKLKTKLLLIKIIFDDDILKNISKLR